MDKLLHLLRFLVPISMRRYMKDTMEGIRRRVPGKQTGLPKYGLGPTQIYPIGTNFFSVLDAATREKLSGIGLSPTTPVASIGTCFAEEFAYFMLDRGYNYVRTESDVLAASANWGRVYTIPNLLQIVRYSTERSYPLVIEQSEHGWFDPLREPRASYSPSFKTAGEAILAHRLASYEALSSCEVIIITVGQNEAWVDASNGQVWANIPPHDVLNLRRHDFSTTEFSFEENVSALREVVNILQTINSNMRILFTVSPVASHATFSDMDIVSRSFANKCLLRTVVNSIVASQPTGVFYFPSFEMVLCDNPHNFRADNRHVKYATVDRIFSLLSKSTSLH